MLILYPEWAIYIGWLSNSHGHLHAGSNTLGHSGFASTKLLKNPNSLERTGSYPVGGRLDFKPFKMGRYLLLERLATGGMAEVYRARSQGAGGFEKQVAIKRILPSYSQNEEFRKMFEYEARLSSMLTHANIAQIFDFNKFAETYLLAMEYVDGKNLRQFVNKARKGNVTYSIEFSVFIINEVCKGLEYAHGKKDEMTGKPLNIIHRDMSPQNIMLSYEGAVKIVDFGIAKAKDRVDETRSGIIKGKFGYMSPEQANGNPVDHRTDIFSTGIILWELLTGRRLFSAESDMATLRMIQECVITPPSKINPRVTPELERIVMKILSKDLKLRYASAGDLHRQLLEYLSKNAPTFAQREVSDILHRVFADEIANEKKRFEQLNRQSIPFSQGARKRNASGEDGLDDVKNVLDGMQTKSDIVEETGETFSEEHRVEQGEPEVPENSQFDVMSSERQSAETAISYTLEEDISEESPLSEKESATKSQASVPTEAAESESGQEESTRGKDSHSGIALQPEGKEVDLVLPGGRKHAFGKSSDEKTGSRRWKGAEIMSMGEGSHNSKPTQTPAPKTESVSEPAKVDLSVSEITGSKTEQGTIAMPKSQAPADPVPAWVPPATPAPRQPDKIQLGGSMDAPMPKEHPTPWDQPRRPKGPRPQQRKRPKRLFHPIVPLLMVMGMTGYVYKLYLDGVVTEFIEKTNSREPTQSPAGQPAPEADDAVDRKPVGDCTVEIRSQPAGAEVHEGAVSRGLTPLVLSGPCNRSVNIVLRKEGFEYLSENVVIGPKVTEWSRALKPIPTGSLVLNLGFNAAVFINGDHVQDARARTPLVLGLRAKRTHKIRLVNPALKLDIETSVSIEEGQNSTVAFSLDEALAKTLATKKK